MPLSAVRERRVRGEPDLDVAVAAARGAALCRLALTDGPQAVPDPDPAGPAPRRRTGTCDHGRPLPGTAAAGACPLCAAGVFDADRQPWPGSPAARIEAVARADPPPVPAWPPPAPPPTTWPADQPQHPMVAVVGGRVLYAVPPAGPAAEGVVVPFRRPRRPG